MVQRAFQHSNVIGRILFRRITIRGSKKSVLLQLLTSCINIKVLSWLHPVTWKSFFFDIFHHPSKFGRQKLVVNRVLGRKADILVRKLQCWSFLLATKSYKVWLCRTDLDLVQLPVFGEEPDPLSGGKKVLADRSALVRCENFLKHPSSGDIIR